MLARIKSANWHSIKSSAESATKWLVPKLCVACQANRANEPHSLCEDCNMTLITRQNYCQNCGQDFTATTDYCGRCLSDSPYYDYCLSPYAFTGTMQNLIWRFKYTQQVYLADAIVKLFLDELDIETLPEAIVATPIHRLKLRQRGFNQSFLLAKRIARQLDIPCLNDAVHKSKLTESQTRLSLKARQSNVKNSFSAAKTHDYQHIAIVDDVITTGATMNEISKTMKKNGVDYIQAWGLAHTLASKT